MRNSRRGTGILRARALAHLGDRRVGLLALVALVSLAAFHAEETLAQGKGEDERLNLFLDTERLSEPSTSEAPSSSETPVEADKTPKTRDLRRDLGGGWRVDPIFLKRAQTGERIDSEEELRDGLFGIELRRGF